jgi:putative ABC transport system substrate-binding protein
MTLVLASLVACGGDDAKPDKTIALLRTSILPVASQSAFLDELANEGWVEGENLTVLDPDPEEVHPDVTDAADAVRGWIDAGADLIVAFSTQSALAAMEATDDVPILAIANDPVASGMVADPRAPEGNVTGLAFHVPADRTLDIARRIGDDITRIGVLYPADDPGAVPIKEALEGAGAELDLTLVAESFVGPDDVADAVGRLVAAGVQVVITVNAPATVNAMDQIGEATSDAMLPIVANIETNTAAVVVLAPEVVQTYRQAAQQAARLFDGADVADVPIEEPGDYRLVVRADVAEHLGIELPTDLVEQADEVTGADAATG